MENCQWKSKEDALISGMMNVVLQFIARCWKRTLTLFFFQTKVKKCVKILHDVKMDFFEKPGISKKFSRINFICFDPKQVQTEENRLRN